VATVSAYERLQIESLLQSAPPPAIEPGSGLAIFGDSSPYGRHVYDTAVAPAMRMAGLNRTDIVLAFDQDSTLAAVCRYVQMAEAIVADVTDQNPSVMYVLGLCHALGRCPILITGGGDETLPFNLRALRHLRFAAHKGGLLHLREELARALRVFLAAASNAD
jgi:hypothetical protein